MRVCSLAILVLLLSACATTPAGVEYLDPETAESKDELKRLKGGLEETTPGSGEYEVILSVLNARSKAVSFRLSLKDETGVRTIWSNERITGHFTLADKPSDQEMSAASRMAAVKIRGLNATLVVDGEEFPIELETDQSRVWVVMLTESGTNVGNFDIH